MIDFRWPKGFRHPWWVGWLRILGCIVWLFAAWALIVLVIAIVWKEW